MDNLSEQIIKYVDENEYGDYKNDDVDGVMFKLFKVEE